MTGLACHRQLGGDAELITLLKSTSATCLITKPSALGEKESKVDRRWNVFFISCATVFVDGWPESMHPSPSCLRQLRHRFAAMHRKECARFAA